jgi:hypothetical protein
MLYLNDYTDQTSYPINRENIPALLGISKCDFVLFFYSSIDAVNAFLTNEEVSEEKVFL